jgi:hypothetical protein
MPRRRLVMLTRAILLRAKVHRVPEGYALDPDSADYLYLVLQRKRLSLAATVGRLRPRTLLLWPLIALIVLLKTFDLWIATRIIRAMLTEQLLLERRSGIRVTRPR